MPTRTRKARAQESFGVRLARLRKARGLTQGELGDKVGLSYRMVAYYEGETDRPPAHVLPELARALEVGVDELLGLHAPRTKAPEPPVNLRLWRKLRLVENLPPADRRAVVRYIELLARQHQARRG